MFHAYDNLKKVLKVVDVLDIITGESEIATNPSLENLLDMSYNRGLYALDMLDRLKMLDKYYIVEDFSGNEVFQVESPLYLKRIEFTSNPFHYGEISGQSVLYFGESPPQYEDAEYMMPYYKQWGFKELETLEGFEIQGARVFEQFNPGAKGTIFYTGYGEWYTPPGGGSPEYIGRVNIHPDFLRIMVHPDAGKDYDLMGAFVPSNYNSIYHLLSFGTTLPERFFNWTYYNRTPPEGGSFFWEGVAQRYRYWLDPAANEGLLEKIEDSYHTTYYTIGGGHTTHIHPFFPESPQQLGLSQN